MYTLFKPHLSPFYQESVSSAQRFFSIFTLSGMIGVGCNHGNYVRRDFARKLLCEIRFTLKFIWHCSAACWTKKRVKILKYLQETTVEL